MEIPLENKDIIFSRDIKTIPADQVKVTYDQVFDLSGIRDKKMLEGVKGYLELFQKSIFTYSFYVGDVLKTYELSGQEILKHIKNNNDFLVSAREKNPKIFRMYDYEMLELMQNTAFPNGKIPIYESLPKNKNTEFPHDICVSIIRESPFVSEEGKGIPMALQLSRDYLLNREQVGSDGLRYPVTLDGVLSNEIYNLFSGDKKDSRSIVFANAITYPLGYTERAAGAGVKKIETPRKEIITLYQNAYLSSEEKDQKALGYLIQGARDMAQGNEKKELKNLERLINGKSFDGEIKKELEFLVKIIQHDGDLTTVPEQKQGYDEKVNQFKKHIKEQGL
jgi:hypothetical protein